MLEGENFAKSQKQNHHQLLNSKQSIKNSNGDFIKKSILYYVEFLLLVITKESSMKYIKYLLFLTPL